MTVGLGALGAGEEFAKYRRVVPVQAIFLFSMDFRGRPGILIDTGLAALCIISIAGKLAHNGAC